MESVLSYVYINTNTYEKHLFWPFNYTKTAFMSCENWAAIQSV